MNAKRILSVLLVLGFSVLMVGCYELQGSMVFNEQGEAEVSVGLKADEIMAGDEARLIAWQLEFLFPEIDLKYEKTAKVITENYSKYYVVEWKSAGKVDMSESDFFTFEKKSDGTFEFRASIPRVFEKAASADEKDKIVLVFSVTLPREIDMANTTLVSGNTATWNITRGMLDQAITMRAFTK